MTIVGDQGDGWRIKAMTDQATSASRGFVGWISTNNPFYVLSAFFVCLGLLASFGPGSGDSSKPWALMAGMSGYALLLGATACLLVRFVGVWDDVRTVLLLVVLWFLATSVTNDEALTRDPGQGLADGLIGLGFSMGLSELMLWGMRLKLPFWFRLPHHGLLALFFLYPIAIAFWSESLGDRALSWGLYGFSLAASLMFLTLLPAVRQGRDYIINNGSPWRWAWYPWTLFGVFAFGSMARSALICWSLHHPSRLEAEPYIFGFYFLAPILLAWAVVLLEIGVKEGHEILKGLAMAIPGAAIAISSLGHRGESAYQEFLWDFWEVLGLTPLECSLVAASVFYGYAMLRRSHSALGCLTACLLMLTMLAPKTVALFTINGTIAPEPRLWPLLTLGFLQLGLSVKARSSEHGIVAAGCLAFAFATGLRDWGVLSSMGRNALAYHLIMIAMLGMGAWRQEPFNRFLRSVGAVMAVFSALVGLTGWGGLSGLWVYLYLFGLGGLILGYGRYFEHQVVVRCGFGILVCGVLKTVLQGYLPLRSTIVGLDLIVGGLALFVLAVCTSLAKAGVFSWSGFFSWLGIIPTKSANVLDAPIQTESKVIESSVLDG